MLLLLDRLSGFDVNAACHLNLLQKLHFRVELKKLRLKVDKLRRLKPEQKKAGGKFNNAEQIYQKLIEEANDAIISTNRDGMIITFNKKAEELLGYSREEIVGKSATLLVHPRYREAQRKTIEKFKRTNELDINKRTIEGKGLRKDGQEIPLESSYYTLEISGKQIITAIIRNLEFRVC